MGGVVNRFLNVKAVVVALNQEKALVGAFSEIVETDGSFAALDWIILLRRAGGTNTKAGVLVMMWSVTA